MTTRRCGVKNNHGFLCLQPARFRVYWQSTGDDSLDSCAQHLPKAVSQILAPSHISPSSVAKVREYPK